MAHTLDGTWHGLYSYPGARTPESFVAAIQQTGEAISGTITETSADVAGHSQSREAALDGAASLPAVGFIKRYLPERAGGWAHAVVYRGWLSDDGTEIEGRWEVPGDWGGPFLLIRDTALPQADLAARFEELDA